MQISYDLKFVILSVFVAIISSYAALGIFPSFTQKEKETRFIALTTGGLMGLGIWTMHFIGMKALITPVDINYDIFITILSILPAILGASMAFYTLIPKKMILPTKKRLLISALILAISISIMHYTGMTAMIMSAKIRYNPFLVILSIFIVFFASYISLVYFANLSFSGYSRIKKQGKTFPAILMGLAISLMHYTGMIATNFIQDFTVSHRSSLLLNEYSIYGLAFYCALMLLMASLVVAVTVNKT
jgi:NO-binding membrane sensor protein with MHYT domain